MNYIGPNDGEGVRIYYNGEVASKTTKTEGSYSAGDGKITVGRYYTNTDALYASFQVDELIFFNQILSNDNINLLYTAA